MWVPSDDPCRAIEIVVYRERITDQLCATFEVYLDSPKPQRNPRFKIGGFSRRGSAGDRYQTFLKKPCVNTPEYR
jgi:hypothetical protein